MAIPTIPDEPLTLASERSLIYAVGELAGMTVVEMAEMIGITDRQAYNNRARDEDEINALMNRLRPMIRVNRREIRQIERAKIIEEVEKRIGMSFETWDGAMQSGDKELAYKAGVEVRDRMIGKPVATTNVRGSVAHQIVAEMTVILPEAAREALRVGISRDLGLLVRANQLLQGEKPVITVESESSDQS